MSRGTIYHITLDPTACGGMDESDFYESLDIMHADSVINQPAEDAANSIKTLTDWLKNAKFNVIESNLPDDCNAAIKTGSTTELANCKRRLFAPAFDRLKSRINNLTLYTFATDFVEISAIRNILEDTYADAVYFDSGYGPATYTLDGFMRRLEPDKTYFISANTVWMH